MASPALAGVPAVAHQAKPPSWRPLLHPGSEDLSVPDYFPTKSGQLEDDMSEKTVKAGLPAKQAVNNESFSAHGLILGLLPSLIPTLNSLFDETLRRRDFLSDLPQVKPSTFRPPPRVTLNEAKLTAYVRDLADPEVPLSRLAKNIPHGFRGERMLEMLWLGANPTSVGTTATALTSSSRTGQTVHAAPLPKSVDINRALWFIQSVGATDIASRSRSATATSSASYSVDFTILCVSWLKKQLAELPHAGLGQMAEDAVIQPSILPPGPPVPSHNQQAHSARQSMPSFAGSPLSSDEARRRWASKWRYSMRLMSMLLATHLLDTRQWMVFVVDALVSATVAQLPLALELADDWLSDILQRGHLASAILHAICSHLQTMRGCSNTHAFSQTLTKSLVRILRRAWALNPESFVAHRLWKDWKSLLFAELTEDEESTTSQCARSEQLASIERRSIPEALHGSLETATSQSNAEQAMKLELLHRLDAFQDAAELDELTEMLVACMQVLGPRSTVEFVLKWATTSLRCSVGSEWRPVLASRILHRLYVQQQGHLRRRKRRKKEEADVAAWIAFDLPQSLCLWLEALDQRESEARDTHFDSVVVLFAELVDRSLFSYPRFLHRLTARGLGFGSTAKSVAIDLVDDGTLANGTVGDSHQVRLLRALPLNASSASLTHQRRLALYGIRQKETREEAILRRTLRELANITSLMAGPSGSPGNLSKKQLLASTPHLWQASRYTTLKVMSEYLLPSALSWFQDPGVPDGGHLAAYLVIVEEARDFRILFELICGILVQLANSSSETPPLEFASSLEEYIPPLMQVLEIHSKVWTSYELSRVVNSSVAALSAALHSVQGTVSTTSATDSPACTSGQELSNHLSRLRADALTALRDLPSIMPGASDGHTPNGVLAGPDESNIDGCSAQAALSGETLPDHLSPLRGIQKMSPNALDVSDCKQAIRDVFRSLLPAAAKATVASAHCGPADGSSTTFIADEPREIYALVEAAVRPVLAAQQTIDDILVQLLEDSLRCTSVYLTEDVTDLLAMLLLGLSCQRAVQVEGILIVLVLPVLQDSVREPASGESSQTHPFLPLALRFMALLAGSAERTLHSLTPAHDLARRACLCSAANLTLINVAALLAIRACSGADHAGEQSALGTLRTIMNLANVKDCVTAEPAVLGNALRQSLHAVWGERTQPIALMFDAVSDGTSMHRLLGPAEVSDIPAADLSSIEERLDPLTISFLVEELVFVLERLTAVEAGQQAQAEGKIHQIAQLVFPRMFLTRATDLTRHGLRLWDNAARLFRSSIVETGFQHLLSSMESEDCDSQSSISAVNAALFSLLDQGCPDQRFPACGTDIIAKVWHCLYTALSAAALNAAHVLKAGSPISKALADVLWLLTRVPTFSTLPSARVQLPQLMAHLALWVATSPTQARGEPIASKDTMLYIHDLLRYLEAEIPTDLLSSLSSALQVALSDGDAGVHLSAFCSRQQLTRLTHLLPYGHTSISPASSMILGSSIQRASESGDYAPAPDRPWAWTEPLDSAASANANGLPPSQHAGNTETAQNPLMHSRTCNPLTLPALANHTSLPLSWFAPLRTTNMPADPAADFRVQEAMRLRWPQTSAGDEDEDGWRLLRSERAAFFSVQPQVDFAALDAPHGQGHSSNRSEEPTIQLQGTRGEALRSRMEPTIGTGRVDVIVGLPPGPPRTMEAYLEAERQRKHEVSSSVPRSASPGTATKKRRPQARPLKPSDDATDLGDAEGEPGATVGPSRKRKNSATASTKEAGTSGGGRKRRGSSASNASSGRGTSSSRGGGRKKKSAS
ncbi:unnamed protein product [Parajaminaea phylloscopi]